MLIRPRLIDDIPWGEVVDRGRTFRWRMITHWVVPEAVRLYVADARLLPRMLATLIQLGRDAQKKRAYLYPGALDVADPFHVKDAADIGHSGDGKAVLAEFQTDHAFPVRVILTPLQARRTASALHMQFANATRGNNFPLTGVDAPLRMRKFDADEPAQSDAQGVETERIVDLPWACALPEATIIHFQLTALGRDRPTLYGIVTTFLPRVLAILTHHARMLERARSNAPDPTWRTAETYRVTKLARCGHAEDRSYVLIEFDTDHGFPLSFALASDRALETVERLQQEAGRATAAKRKARKARPDGTRVRSDPLA